eukprot:TRINITY_DN31859_c0_g1_i1.p1 TRINITY_DN31859_c0_g1~~TRINITY_DN31859_c0_g1_i1.p1  ORF type:complete len:272 (-),score=52.31 TRINITY_DN31859_c0_g1_i1:406-1221(-)
MAVAIRKGQLLSLPIVSRILTLLLQGEEMLDDFGFDDGLEEVDPMLKKSLQWIMDSNELADMDLSFSMDMLDERGQRVSIPLCDDGSDKPVIASNKQDYVALMVQAKARHWAIPLAELRASVHKLIPAEHLAPFSANELELLISGLPTIDVDDWREHTEYRGCLDSDKECIWFWEILGRMTQEQRALLLQFATGTTRVPIQGFGQLYGYSGLQMFTIAMFPGCSPLNLAGALPTSSTCFNMLKLPQCSSLEDLEERLHVVVRHGCEGFSFS